LLAPHRGGSAGSDTGDQPGRRTGRDWFVDILCVVLSILGGLALFIGESSARAEGMPLTIRTIDIGCGVLGAVAIWFRRRWPVGVALLLIIPSMVSSSVQIAAAIAAFTVVVHRPLRIAVPITAAYVVSAIAYTFLYPDQSADWWVQMIWAIIFSSAVFAWGMFVRARRQLVLSLHDRVERAEAEQQMTVERARAAERHRIAREMHDVMAHRVSLIALHAGGLEVGTDLSTAQVRETARLIGATARQALEELRDVIGVLRDPGAEIDAPSAPQPTIVDLERLVRDSQRAGEQVSFRSDVTSPNAVPGPVGRAAFRIVQEALTNVHKHAPSTATEVVLMGAPGRDLLVSISNRLPVGRGGAELPGAGAGLVGLAERVALVGGQLEHGAHDGWFRVRAHLPWPA
jgi:signal transduction histidine kinase